MALTKSRHCLVLATAALLLIGVILGGCGGKPQAEGEKKGETQKANYPTKPITLIIPYDAGGGTDVITRKLASLAEKHLPQPFAPVNKPGNTGAVGYMELYNSKPDGYTICAVTSTIVTHKLLGNIPYNHQDYAPIITYNYGPAAIAVNSQRPWKTLDEFVKHAKANPGQVTLATVSPGGIWNIATQVFLKETGLQVKIVPSGGGGAQAIIQAAGGHADAVVAGPDEMLTQLQSGNLRLLAVMAPERLSRFPDVPTMKELGYNVVVVTTRALLAPKGTPKEAIDVLYKAFKAAAESQEYKDFLKENGIGWMALGPEETLKYYDEQEKLFSKIIEETKAQQKK